MIKIIKNFEQTFLEAVNFLSSIIIVTGTYILIVYRSLIVITIFVIVVIIIIIIIIFTIKIKVYEHYVLG